MLFSSLTFLWLFLPAVVVLNLLLTRIGGNRAANVLLLAASLLFYAWGEPVYIVLMLVSVLINYAAGILLSRVSGVGGGRRALLWLTVVTNLALLMYFKYAGMLVSLANRLFRTSFEVPAIALPIGISFFTFQAMSYVIDVYRHTCTAQKNPLKLALYISFFPQLIAGPIVKYREIHEQIDHRQITLSQTAEGIRRFACGLAKKVLIANTLAECADRIYALEMTAVTGAMLWFASLAYTLQIYYDFSGYSDMAIGLGRMFGFSFSENFSYPYTSASVREFWRRWHISLSSWFRDYVYIPLGGSRKGAMRTCLNLVLVFALTGLWHGASLSFLFWGLFHGAFLLLERTGFDRVLKRIRPAGYLYTFLVAHFGWVFFRTEHIRDALRIIKRLCLPFLYTETSLVFRELVGLRHITVMTVALLGTGMGQRIIKGRRERLYLVWKHSVPETVFCAVLLVLSVMSLANDTYNPFIYFRF